MDKNKTEEGYKSTISRRGFIKSAAAVSATSFLSGAKIIPMYFGSERNGEYQSSVLFSPEFVPGGYSCKMAFVADQ